jgi:hypothetical protein
MDWERGRSESRGGYPRKPNSPLRSCSRPRTRTDGLYSISSQNTQYLENGIPRPRTQTPSPPVVNTVLYRYNPVALGGSEIRLIELDPGTSRTDQVICKLFAVPLTQAPKYEALSYT